MSARLDAVALALRELGGTLIEIGDDDLGVHAVAYAQAGWEVFPLHDWNCRCAQCSLPADNPNRSTPGKSPRTRHGVLEATIDLGQIVDWWTRWPTANIGGRVPAGVVVVDVDPRSGGNVSWAALEAEHGQVMTRTALSGRGDGGGHRYLRHPGGKVRGTIGAGLDVKTHAGYTVLPPSIHPDSGQPYRWIDPTAPIASPPAWLSALLRPPIAPPRLPARSVAGSYGGDSIADWYTDTHTWADVLHPHGWTLVAGGGDDDGSAWRHPTSTSSKPATIKHGCLFVFSPNTVFEQTGAEAPHGYTRFRAYAMLDHGGDMSATARAARANRDEAA